MKKTNIINGVVFSLFACFHAHGQIDTSLTLKTISIYGEQEIKDKTLRESAETEIIEALSATLGTKIMTKSGAFLKDYGPGGINTLTHRGSSASQVKIYWNDLPINNPMLALFDFSLSPVSLFSNGIIQENPLNSIAANIVLIDDFQSNADCSTLIFGHGSFKKNAATFQGNYSRKGLKIVPQVYYQEANNDFSYRLSNDTEKKQKHAETELYGIKTGVNHQFSNDTEISYNTWWQKSKRNIPPTTVQNRSAAHQRDEHWRNVLKISTQYQNTDMDLTLGYSTELNEFQDSLQLISSSNRFDLIFAQAKIQRILANSLYSFSARSSFYFAESPNYSHEMKQNRTEINLLWKKFFHDTALEVQYGQKFWNAELVSPDIGFNISHDLYKYIDIRGHISRNTRIPGLNDLFWIPGGNPELKVEKSFKQSLAFAFKHQENATKYQYTIEGFNRYTNNWILWSFLPEFNYWSATNLAEVWSRGFEHRFSVEASYAHSTFAFQLGHYFTKSTNQKSIQIPNISAGQALNYIPKNKLVSDIKYTYQNWSFGYNFMYVSPTSGINLDIEDYHISNMAIGKSFKFSSLKSHFSLQIENIFDENYRVIEYRPLPGRSFLFQIQIDI